MPILPARWRNGNAPAGGRWAPITDKEHPSVRCRGYFVKKGGFWMFYIMRPAFCDAIPTFTPCAGPRWEYKCMIVRRNEYPTGYRLRRNDKGYIFQIAAAGSRRNTRRFICRRWCAVASAVSGLIPAGGNNAGRRATRQPGASAYDKCLTKWWNRHRAATRRSTKHRESKSRAGRAHSANFAVRPHV